MDWGQLLKAGGETAQVKGALLDDGHIKGSNRSNNNNNNDD